LAAFVFAEEMEVQDQEAAELYYRNYGVVSLKMHSKASVKTKITHLNYVNSGHPGTAALAP